MSCCGQKRLNWQQNTISHPETPPPPPDPKPLNPVPIGYDGRTTVMVKGKQSGFLYIFAPGEQGLTVDERDVNQILSESKKFFMASKGKNK
jgi:hypothetical protein